MCSDNFQKICNQEIGQRLYLTRAQAHGMHRFRELEIWKKSIDFCSVLYHETETVPASERFGLTAQIRRAAVSIPSNIAEGCSRNSAWDFSRFLEIAIGSAYEVETQLYIISKLNFIKDNVTENLVSKIHEIIKMTVKYKATIDSNLLPKA